MFVPHKLHVHSPVLGLTFLGASITPALKWTNVLATSGGYSLITQSMPHLDLAVACHLAEGGRFSTSSFHISCCFSRIARFNAYKVCV